MADIWLPQSETKATVIDGVVTVWDEMSLHPQPVAKHPAGFSHQPATVTATTNLQDVKVTHTEQTK